MKPALFLLIGFFTCLPEAQPLLADRESGTVESSQKNADLTPGDPHVWFALADALASAGRMRDTIEPHQKALTISKTAEARIECYRRLAHCQQRASDAEGALKTWRQLIQEFPADTDGLDEAGDAMTDAARYADAQSFYQTSRESQGASADQKARAIFKLAQLAEIQHADEKARALYENALQIVPANGWMTREARHRIDDSFRRLKDISGLAASCESWLKTHSQDVDAALRLGNALSKLDRKPEAIAWLRKAAGWAPTRKDVKIALAGFLLDNAQPKEAVEILCKITLTEVAEPTDRERLADAEWQLFQATKDEQAERAAIKEWHRLALPPALPSQADPKRVLRVAEIFRAHGMPEIALRFYERAAILAPEAPPFRERWADYLTDLKRDAEARKVLHGLVEGPRAKASDFLLLARLWRARNDNDDALETVRAALDLDPTNFELLSFEWILLAAANQWQDAAGLAERLIDAAPSLASAVQVEDNHAQALRKLGTLSETLEKYAQRLRNGPPLSETALRLLVGLALRDGNLDLAGKGFDAATRFLPNSAALVYDRAEYERRKGHIEQSVAAFQRLADLQPAQKTAWLRQITRTYRDENLADSALAAAQRLIEADPANPDSMELAADADFAAGKFDAGVARLRVAIRLSEKPNPLRLKLARAFLNANQLDNARASFEIAFTSERDPVARVSLSGELADAYARSGRLDDLIARFREHKHSENDGWQYALYLSEIFLQQNDYTAARQELTKAFGPRSRDIAFLTQSSRVSAYEGHADRAHAARLLADADPTDATRIEFVSALTANGEAKEALNTVEENQDALFKDPLKWHDALARLREAGAGEEIAGILQSGLAQHADDWRIRLLLAETRLYTSEMDAAEKLLREIESLPVEAAALPPSTLPDASVDRSSTPRLFGFSGNIAYSSGASGPAGSEFARRIARGYLVRQDLEQIAMGLKASSSSVIMNGGLPGPLQLDPIFGSSALAETLRGAADAALIIRAVLAQRQGRGPAFLTALEEKLRAQPRSERLAILTLVQALDPLMKEIENEAAHPSGDDTLNADCLEILMSLSNTISSSTGDLDVDLPQLIPALQTFLQREIRPNTSLTGKCILSRALQAVGRASESQEVIRDVLGHWDAAPRSRDSELFRLAIEHHDLETAQKILSRIPEDSSLDTTLAEAILAEKRADPRAVPLLSAALRISYGMTPRGLSSNGPRDVFSAWNGPRVFPYGDRYAPGPYLDETWSEIFDVAKTGGLLAEMKAAIDRQILSLPAEQGKSARFARVCFLWWNNERDDALREIVAFADAQKSDELHLTAASMLADAGRREDARKALDQVLATSGDAGAGKLVGLLELARAANDAPKVKQIALRLADLPLSWNDRTRLQEILNQLGLAEKAAELNARSGVRSQAPALSELDRLTNQLYQAMQAKRESDSIAIARVILSRPLPEPDSWEDAAVQRSLAALRQFKALSAYIAELEQSLATSRAPALTLLLLAEASEREQPEKLIDYYRRFMEFEPNNMDDQARFALMLTRSKRTEDAIRIWDRVLARQPNLIFGNHFHTVMSAYETANQLSRFGDALLQEQLHTNPLPDMAFDETSADILRVAEALREAGNADDAIRLWRAILERKRSISNVGPGDSQTVMQLIYTLLERGRKDEAAQELESFFFPQENPKSAMGFDIRAGMGNRTSASYWISGQDELDAMPFVRLATRAGALDRLRSKAVAAAAAHPQGPESFLVLLIDIIRRDPAKLGDLKNEFDEALKSSPKTALSSASSTLFLLARTLSEWPEGRPLALSIEEKTSHPLELVDGRGTLQQAELAVQLGEKESARKALRKWIDETDGKQRPPNPFIFSQELSAIDLMSRAGMESEARERFQKVQGRIDVQIPLETKQQQEELSNRLALLAGETGHAQITLGTTPRGDDAQKTTVFWEIGPATSAEANHSNAGPSSDQRPTITGEGLSKLDGRFSIELFHGPTPSVLKSLATIPAAKVRGAWESPDPLGQGYVVAVLREEGVVAFTQKAFVPGGANELVNPNLESGSAPNIPAAAIRGWPGLNPGDFEQLPDGPFPGGRCIRLDVLDQRSQIHLQRIPLDPARNYYLTGWLRAAPNRTGFGLSGQFLDKGGKPIKVLDCKFSGISGRWVSWSLRLFRAPVENPDDGTEQIPEEAAFFEPEIFTSAGQCDLSGLYFGVISPESSPAK